MMKQIKCFTEIRKSNVYKNLIENILIQIIKINTNTINSKNYWTYGQGHECGQADILLLYKMDVCHLYLRTECLCLCRV